MAISSGEDAQQSSRLNIFRLGTSRLNCAIPADNLYTGDNNRYQWERHESDAVSPTWTEETE